MEDEYSKLLSVIYDSAVDVEMWPQALVSIRDFFSAKLVNFALMDARSMAEGAIPAHVIMHTPWDHPRCKDWMDAMPQLEQTQQIPEFETIMFREIDDPTSQMSHISEEDFRQTSFSQNWIEPFGLRDALSVQFLKRNDLAAMLAVVSGPERDLFCDTDFALMRKIAPHIRRAALINDMWRENKALIALQRKLLDQISSAVFIVRKDAKIAYVNAVADEMLSSGNFLVSRNGILTSSISTICTAELFRAIEVACENSNLLECRGVGLPLMGTSGELASAYVLPLQGEGCRGALDQGAVAVFVSNRKNQQPVMIEVLRTVFDLTPREARVASLVAIGSSAQSIADALGISVNTLRTHLARCFTKTGSKDQIALAGIVNKLLPPVNVTNNPVH